MIIGDNMRKYAGIATGIVLIIVLFLIFTNTTKVTTCKLNNKQSNYDITSTYSIKSRGDVVKSVEVNQTITSKEKDILKSFEEQYKNQYSLNKKLYGGYNYEVKINNNKLVTKVTIDYDDFKLDKFVKDNKAMKKYINKDNEFTLEGAKKLYNSTGAKCE